MIIKETPKAVMLAMEIAPHTGELLTYITQGDVFKRFEDHECRFSETAAPGTGPLSLLLFSTFTGHSRLLFFWSRIYDKSFDLM